MFYFINLRVLSFPFSVVGRGVLQIWGCRYRKTRSKLLVISKNCVISWRLGVDII